jgi:SAM-dependent methyltransferase
MTWSHPREPHGRALLDFFAGVTAATIIVHSSLGEHDEMPVAVFFRGPDAFFAFERAALELCRGRVLDVGAGAGVHALYLQDQDFDVCAIDVLPEAVQIMQLAGVRDARLADINDFDEEPFDTILMMMNGTGILETLVGLDRFLRDVQRLLAPGGQVLLDSGPANLVGQPDDAAVALPVDEEAGYPGEVWIELEYLGKKGPPFRELYVDSEMLARHASSGGWECDIIFRDGHGGYVARLTLPCD